MERQPKLAQRLAPACQAVFSDPRAVAQIKVAPYPKSVGLTTALAALRVLDQGDRRNSVKTETFGLAAPDDASQAHELSASLSGLSSSERREAARHPFIAITSRRFQSLCSSLWRRAGLLKCSTNFTMSAFRNFQQVSSWVVDGSGKRGQKSGGLVAFRSDPFPLGMGCSLGTARSGQGRAVVARRSEPLRARTVLRSSCKRERCGPEWTAKMAQSLAAANKLGGLQEDCQPILPSKPENPKFS